LGATRTEARMQATGLDLGLLLALVSLEGLDGTGRIDGEIPFVREGGVLRVEHGSLRASPEGGRIRYRPTQAIAKYAASRPNDLGLAVTAMSDFHYEKLEASVDGDVGAELHIELHVRGANPAVQDGHPIELNLALDAEVADVVRSGQATYGVPKGLEERLRRLMGEEKQGVKNP
ncbi:MAG TPA: YdbH domain-containing protein, partial [Myxococcota bacterium]|nr:YdbH domain-containing protein [Myxococcota bacterium]